MPAPTPTSAAATSDRAIQNLIATYAELVDGGDFAGLGVLFADATLSLNGGEPLAGAAAIERFAHDTLLTYDDGTPRTRHVISNVFAEVDEAAGTAVARSYFTVLQSLPELPLQPIASGRHLDRYARRDGRWRFAERRVVTDFTGDVSHHVRSGGAGSGR